MLEHRRNSDLITELLDLPGKRVLDIGCGSGSLTRFMSRQGAIVTGIECNPRQMEKAITADVAGQEAYLDGRGEALPIENHSSEIVIYFNSLHHVPVEYQDKALAEAARVLLPNGQLYICEPVAAGPHFEMMRPIDDETHVREQACLAIQRALETLFSESCEVTYLHTVKHTNFEDFEEEMTRINPDRDILFQAKRDQMREAFAVFGTGMPDGRVSFEQPMRVNLLTKREIAL